MNYEDLVFSFSDIPNKRNYLFSRLKKIYPTTSEKVINRILDSIKIRFRDQKERGSSNHIKRTIFLPVKDLINNKIKVKKDIISYLEDPKSTITHETIHIFQNLSETFPHVQYLEKNEEGEVVIDYDKYLSDSGEKQSRLEQVIELLNWGFSKEEIIQLLYNRKHDDRSLWKRIIDFVEEKREQEKKSTLWLVSH